MSDADLPLELQLEAAVCRVSQAAAAESAPRVTKDEVRCILERFPLEADEAVSRCPNLYGTPKEGAVEPSPWDEAEAVREVWLLKAGRAAELVDSSSAGQSTSAAEVHLHCLDMAIKSSPWGAS